MNVDRRTFVKGMALAGGGALGIMLSPTPWYLIRDLAFWTQNWPWVPAPAPGEPSFEKSICRICDGGCGINVRKVDMRLVRIDGDKEHPVNQGSICPMGAAALQMLYGPSRTKVPLRRVGPRENPEWRPITWAEAIREVALKVRQLRAAGRPHELACITNSAHSTVNQFFERFLHAVGSRNFMQMNSALEAHSTVLALMQGVDEGIAYDIENARYLLSFGCNLLEGWGACGRMYHAHANRSAHEGGNSLEIVQIEPNLSVTASKASRWIPIKPGTDAALALSIAHVLISDGLYDKTFVERHTFGFEDWKDSDGKRRRGFKSEVLGRYSPRSVELITQVPANVIEEVAHEFAANQPALALGGRCDGSLFAGIYELMAIHSLNALAGNLSRPGGIFLQCDVPLKSLSPVKMDEQAEQGFAIPRSDGAGSKEHPLARHLPHNLDAGKVGVLLIHEVNPSYALPNRKVARAIFEDIPYIVSFSSFIDESSMQADLILPISTPLERWDDHTGAPGIPYPIYGLSHPLVNPLYESRNAGDVLIEIARELGGTIAESFPWNNTVEALRERAAGLYESGTGVIHTAEFSATYMSQTATPTEVKSFPTFSDFWNALVKNCCWSDPQCTTDQLEQTLKTPGKKFEFFSQRLQKTFGYSNDLECMPHYHEPPPNPQGFDLLIMPENLITMADNGLGTPPLLIKQLSNDVLSENDLFVQVNPITAMYQGLKDGESVILESPAGKVRVRIHTFAGVREGVVLIPLGFGHTAYDRFLRNKGVNALEIFDAKMDTVSGLAVWWAVPGKIYKV